MDDTVALSIGMDAATILLVMASTIFLGFISELLFQRFKAPDVLILITFGILLGPGLTGIVNEDLAGQIALTAPYVGALALAVIMFQAGIDMSINEVLRSLSRAFALTIVAFLASVILTAAVAVIVLHWNLLTSLLLGSILGGTSGAIVIPLVYGLEISPRTRTSLILEAAITDVLVIVMAMSIVQIIRTGNSDIWQGVGSILGSFLISGIIGLIGGVVWLKVLSRLFKRPFSYMITLASLFGIYSITEMLVNGTGGGAIAALVFGLVFANGNQLARYFKPFSKKMTHDARITEFHKEITFFVRTFFFVYLGLVVSTLSISMFALLIGFAIFFALMIGRYATICVIGELISGDKIDRRTLFFMMPRGLCAAVLASVPLTLGAVTIEVGDLILGAVTIVILLSTIFASLGALLIDRSSRNRLPIANDAAAKSEKFSRRLFKETE